MRRLLLLLASLLALSCVDLIPPPLPDDDVNLGSDDDDDTAGPDDDDDTQPDDDDTQPDDDDTFPDDDDTFPDDDDVSDDDDTGDDDDATVTPTSCPCGFGQLCLGTTCSWAPTFAVGMLESASSVIPFAASAQGCFYTASFLGDPIVANDGPCTAAILEPSAIPTQYWEADAGNVTVTGGVLDPITFTGGGPVECLFDDVAIDADLFSPGQLLNFTSTGGADFPAIDELIVAPSPISGVPGAYNPGAPMSMAWSGGGGSYVELVVTAEDPDNGNAHAVTCRVPDIGGYVIPASLTAFLPDDGIEKTAVFARTQAAHLEFPDDLLVIEAIAQTNWTVDLD